MKKNYDELFATIARLEKRITTLEEENIQLRKENKDLALLEKGVTRLLIPRSKPLQSSTPH